MNRKNESALRKYLQIAKNIRPFRSEGDVFESFMRMCVYFILLLFTYLSCVCVCVQKQSPRVIINSPYFRLWKIYILIYFHFISSSLFIYLLILLLLRRPAGKIVTVSAKYLVPFCPSLRSQCKYRRSILRFPYTESINEVQELTGFIVTALHKFQVLFSKDKILLPLSLVGLAQVLYYSYQDFCGQHVTACYCI